MNKIFGVLMLLATSAIVSAVTMTNVTGLKGPIPPAPSNVNVIMLGLGGNQAGDTIAATAGNANCYGPFRVSVDATRPEFKRFRYEALYQWLASGDSVALSYQILAGNTIADTIKGAWTVTDSIGPNGGVGRCNEIDTIPGTSIVFKLANLGSSNTIIQKKIRIVFAAPSTESAKVGGW
jgi:hypothetical protein